MTDWNIDVVVDAGIEVERNQAGQESAILCLARALEGVVLKQDEYNQVFWRVNPTGNSAGEPCVEMSANGILSFQAFVHADALADITVKLFVPATYTQIGFTYPQVRLWNVTLLETESVVNLGAWNSIVFSVAPAMDTIYKIEIVSNSGVVGLFLQIESVLVVEA